MLVYQILKSTVRCTRVPSQKLSEKQFWPVFIQEKVFFHSFLPLTTGFPSKNRMHLTHHQHYFEKFLETFLLTLLKCEHTRNNMAKFSREISRKPGF